MNILESIKSFPDLESVPDDQLQWVIDRGVLTNHSKGDVFFDIGDPLDDLRLLISGGYLIKFKQNNEWRNAGSFKAPQITGVLPYSRAVEAKAYAEFDLDTQILSLNKAHFHDMICNCHELTTVLVHQMSSRIREQTKRAQLNDKMMSLGKLSAGLAHELNNPAAAVVRSSKELNKHLSYVPDKFKAVVKIDITEEQIDAVNDILFDKIKAGVQHLSLMDKSSLEDEVTDWLDDHDIEDPEDIAENVVDYGFDVDDLDRIADSTPAENLEPVIGWINQMLTTNKLVAEIEDASERISKLVLSIKSYTHMDQGNDKTPTDVHTGITNTITMLNHKIRQSNVEVVQDFDEGIPHPEILPSAINQVWTNIIDNAIDAMESSETKQLTIKTSANDAFVTVNFTDTGAGIPDDIQSKIFDPFFTTKGVGKGTGLGLENVIQTIQKQHNGTINVTSSPGNTLFSICIPIKDA